MNTRHWISLLAGVAVLSAATTYWFAQQRDVPPATEAERKVLYWYDPMVPNQHFEQPGKSPFMDMQLVPRYADEATVGEAMQHGVRIDPAIMQNLGMRLAKVERAVLPHRVEAVGNLLFNERDVAVVQARTRGFVTRVYGRAPGDVIARHAPLAEVLTPEWAAAQAEFLALKNSGDTGLVAAARQRMRLFGMSEELIADIERSGREQATVILRAPIAGVIESLSVRAGMNLSAGDTLAQIKGLSTVWLEAAVPEVHAGALVVGGPVEMQLLAFPDKTFMGRVIAILPEANAATRTVRVRIELPNAQGVLRPGMSARVSLDLGDTQPALLIPSEAVIRTGVRNLVMLAAGESRFTPVEITIGRESGDRTVVLSGLTEGQQVVASGQFLIDSEAHLSGVLARASVTPAVASATHTASGRVEALTATEILIAHEPVASLDWPEMTMPFQLKEPAAARDLKPGDEIEFTFEEATDGYVVRQLRKAGASP